MPTELVVALEELEAFGCSSCGYRSGTMPISCAGAAVWTCGDCGASCLVLAEGLTAVPDAWVNECGLPVQPHPRRGIPAHGRPDRQPEGGGEFFHPRGLGKDWTPGCFVCGGPRDLYDNVAAFVQCREAGDRVVAMFERGARLDYREHEPDRVQVKVGACAAHAGSLRALMRATAAEQRVTAAMVRDAAESRP